MSGGRHPGADDNLWQVTAGPEVGAAPLAAQVAADVAIIGGGYTGCSAALHLARDGADVCLLEAQTIGHGGSGRNVGLVNAGLWTPPEAVEAQLGVDAGRKLNAALAEGPELVFSLVEALEIECEATRKGTLHCAQNRRGLADLEDRLRQQLERHAPVELLGADETERCTGTPAFVGALLDHRAGTVQPLAYARGLARAAIAAGARIHEASAAQHYAHDGNAWRVETASGSLTAPVLIVATNAYGTPVTQGVPPGYTPLHYFQFATRPLGDNLGKSILAGGQGCWDCATVLTSFRRDADGRLILGAVGALDGLGATPHRSWVRRKLRSLFPAAGEVEFEHAWFGRLAMTPNHLPKVVPLGPRAVSIFGYSGRGISPGTVFGKAAAEWALSGDPTGFPIAMTGAARDRFSRVKAAFYECGATITHLVGARGVGH